MSAPLINGIRHSWGSIKINMLGRTVTGITAVSYGEKQEKKNNYGAGNHPTSRGRGRKEPNAKITLEAYEVNAIQKAVGIGKSILDIEPFDIVVTFLPEGQDGLVTHVIRNCEFLNNDRDLKEGSTAIPVELELIPSHIQWS